MRPDDGEAEDVAGLFRKFGGDASGYKEFEPAAEVGKPFAGWALVPGSGNVIAESAPSIAVASPAVAPSVAPAVAPVALAATPPVAAPSAATPAVPAAVAMPPSPEPVATAPARELDLLFARLAGTTQPGAEQGHGLMSRWRRSS